MIMRKSTFVNNQQGMAAIMVTVVLMFVISVIVLGFAQTIRREQRNALDNQLSSQAYYAAESGVNLVQSKAKNNTVPLDKTNCEPDGVNFSHADYVIGENAEITCLLINSKVKTLEYQGIGMQSVPMLIKVETGNLNNVYISWQSPTSTAVNAQCNTSKKFPATWLCPQPLMRLDMVPVDGAMSANSLKAKQFTVFLYPTTSGTIPAVAYGAGSMGKIASASCQTPPGGVGSERPKVCTTRISGLNFQAVAARLMSVYGTADVTISASDSPYSPKVLIEGQMQVDTTARAADVLKRVQARIPMASNIIPDFGIVSGSGGICKRYAITGDVVTTDTPACNIP